MSKDFIFDYVLFGPRSTDFSLMILCKPNKIGLDDSFCINEIPFRIQSRTMSGQFSAHIWISITFGFIISFPYIIYQFWSFVSPGLYQNENSARGLLQFLQFYFLSEFIWIFRSNPSINKFLGSYSVSEDIFNDFDLDSYVGLLGLP